MGKSHFEVIVNKTIRTGASSSTLKSAKRNAASLRKKQPTLREITVVKFTPTKTLGKKAYTFKQVWTEKRR